MIHYYTNNENLKSNIKELNIEFKDKIYKIFTDIGVFSKNGLDFGTKVMLEEFFKNHDKKHFDFLDIGCGYGIVSIIIASHFKNSNYTLSDVNDRALSLSKKNLELNNITNFDIIKSNSFENINKNFDIIMSNPPIRAGKDTIFNIYENSYKHLNKDGDFYCVIQTKHGAKSTEKKLKEIFKNCTCLGIHSGYRVYFCKKVV